jgi:hypothetical protein
MKLLSIPIILAIIFLGSCSHQTDIASLDRADILAIAFYVCLTLVVIFMVSSFILYLYYRDKIQYNKRRIKMMLRNKNAEILELSHKNCRKNNDITLLTTKLSCWEKNNNRNISRGRVRFHEIEEGGNVVQWASEDFKYFVDYYELRDFDFVNHLHTDFKDLSSRYKFFLIMEHLGKSETEIMRIMCICLTSIRSIRSRIRQKARGKNKIFKKRMLSLF